MKKIMLLAVVACATMFANAASFSWKLQTGAGYENMTVYAVADSTATTVLAALQGKTEADWTAALTGAATATVSGNNARAGAIGESGNVAVADKLTFVIVDGAVADGSKYWVVNDYSIPAGVTFEPPATGTMVTIKIADLGIAGSGTFTAAVPEPTSGLLMLVGLAGLALRRRRA